MKPGALAPLFAEVFCSTAALEALNEIASEVPLVGGMFSKLAQVRVKTEKMLACEFYLRAFWRADRHFFFKTKPKTILSVLIF